MPLAILGRMPALLPITQRPEYTPHGSGPSAAIR